ncbi:acyl-CoA dehydrogenase [Caldifermentibacillus hisashii]|uniref:acyl-CoA dehydrogenase n=1 Tax=Caldifermentibacillus hisashii TaxID=996558 RepID=UPI0034D3932A
MHLQFTEEQLLLQKMVRDFAEKEIAPFVSNMEAGQFPRQLIEKMGELGLMGIPIPIEYGGTGMDFTAYMMAIHEIAKVSPTLAVILSVHTSVGTYPILNFGTEEQKQQYIPNLASGKYLGAFCLTEPNAGSDVGSLSTRAVKDGDHYVINGSKIFITNGGEADVYIVFVKTNPALGSKGISAFIVEKNTPGFIIGKNEQKMGLHGSKTVQIMFDHLRVHESQRLGKEGEGYKIAMANLDAGRIGIAVQALGIAEGAFLQANAYAKERRQFGVPIIENQGISFKLAEMATQIEAAKLLVYRAAYLKGTGINCSKEASMAKMFASNTAMEVTTEAIQIFGGYGYIKEYDVERYFRDAKITQIYEGTNEIQKVVITKYL